MKLDHFLIPHTRINSEWIKDLNVRPETIKSLEKNTGSKILDIAYSNILTDISPQAREIKEKINKWNYIKQKMFLNSKGKHQQSKKATHRMGEHICQYI